MKVREIMTTRVVTVTPDTPLPVIASLLRDKRISGVPAVDAGGAVVGLVSEYDLLAREGETAGEVMTSSVITVSEDTDVEDVRHLLVERRIRRVSAVSRQRLAGIVSRSDVVALLTTEWACQVCGEAARGQQPPSRCQAAPTVSPCRTPAPEIEGHMKTLDDPAVLRGGGGGGRAAVVEAGLLVPDAGAAGGRQRRARRPRCRPRRPGTGPAGSISRCCWRLSATGCAATRWSTPPGTEARKTPKRRAGKTRCPPSGLSW